MNIPDVYITKTSSYYPNEPISNDEMEDYLGLINEQASKSRRIVLRSNGIKNRFYALDKAGNPTHTNAQMTASAVRGLFDGDAEKLEDIDLLVCGTSSPDQMMPSHAVMVHGWLPETGNIEVVSPSGVCCSGMHAYKYAYMSLKLGEAHKAVTTGSERLSRVMRAENFQLEVARLQELEQNPYISFDKEFLRWMLSDGASAFLMETEPNKDGISLKVEWIEAISFANEKEPCMYMASEKLEDGSLKGYGDYSPEELLSQSIMSIKQDVKLLQPNIVPLGFRKLESIFKKKNLQASDVDHFVPHMSSHFFEDKIEQQLNDNGMHIPKEKWFSNLATHGNVGAGSIYMMVDQLFTSGKLKIGDKVLLAVPESARFSYVFSLLTVV